MGAIRRIGVLTGGGDCPGLNAVIRAVTKCAIMEHQLEVWGIADGFLGLIHNRVRRLVIDDVVNILRHGGTILGTTNQARPRHYLEGKDAQGQPRYVDATDRVLHHIRDHRLDALVVIGGEGSMECAHDLAQQGVPIIGVPKTIDNDLMHTEVTFGFQTAVQTATEAIDRLQDTAASHHRVMLVETMGRNAGWLALHAGIAGAASAILIPEIPYRIEVLTKFLLGRVAEGKSSSIVVVAEGSVPIGGQQVMQEDRLGGVSHVLASQIAEQTGLDVRATILGHIQRGGSPSAYDRVLATVLGHAAIGLLTTQQCNRMVAVQGGRVTSVPLSQVAAVQRTIPPDCVEMQTARAIGVCFGD